MEKKRVLITGGSGLLATNWACAIRGTWDVTLATHQHLVKLNGTNSFQLTLDNLKLLGQQFDRLTPDLVVHTAGMTSVDGCEQSPESAMQVNAVIAKNIATVTANRNIPLVHISTDHLFDGERSFYTETSTTSPVNEYGRTKELAEKWVQTENSNALILRTNFFCWGNQLRQSFSDWLIYSLREDKQLDLFEDVYFSPILADTLALIAHELVEKKVSGVYNLVGDERISKYDFAMKLCQEFSLPTELVRSTQIGDVKLQAKRPKDMSLDNTKIQKVTGRSIGTVAQFLSVLHNQELEGRRVELLEATS
mgnify:FL=1|jgi:dTDP-4-dehydrorhamnose reductase